MPPAAIIGGLGLAGSLGTSIAGAVSSSSRARRAQQSAEQFFQRALQELPTNNINSLRNFTEQPLQQYVPIYVSPQQEQQQIDAILQDAARFSNDQLSAFNENQARRGLFRSGIANEGASRLRENVTRNVTNQIANTRLGFTQERARQNAQGFALNQSVQNQRAAQLQALIAAQQNVFNSLLGPANAALGSAGTANQAAAGAYGNIGTNLSNVGQQALLYNLLNKNGFNF